MGGAHLDTLARRALWQVGLDYDHGTGHGVGSYLSVHEGPVSISRLARPVPIAAGMILSNEPGFYLPDHYGIRLENLLLVQQAALPDATKPFLCFETLTLAPFDRRLLNPAMMTAPERAWLDAYHARVLQEVGPALDQPERGLAGGGLCATLIVWRSTKGAEPGGGDVTSKFRRWHAAGPPRSGPHSPVRNALR